MDIQQLWDLAQEKTEVVRGRVKALATFEATTVPYVFMAESSVNVGHTVIRKGKIVVEKPMIVLPDNMPQFEGFEFEEELDVEQDVVQMFFFMRGIRFPSMKYNNALEQIEVEESSLARQVDKARKKLEKAENVSTALILGPEECWQFSVLFYMAALVGRCARTDIMNLMDRMNGED